MYESNNAAQEHGLLATLEPTDLLDVYWPGASR